MVFENIFILYLGLLPFIIWNGTFEGPKVFYLYFGAAVLCVFYIVTLGKKLIESLKSYDLFFGLFLLTLTISSLLGIHPMESIVGGSYRHQGVIFFFAIWLIGKTINILSKKSKKNFLKVISIWVVAESTILILQKIFSVGTVLGRPLGTLGEPNAVAGFLAIAASFTGSYLLVLVLLSILILNSRTSFLSFLPVIFQRIKKIPKKVFLILIPVGLFVFISAAYFRPSSDVENRGVIANIAVKAILKKPVLGYGAESQEIIYSDYFKEIKEPLVGIMIDRSHNIVLDILIWSGGVGFVFFLSWFFLRTKQLFEAKNWQKLSGVAAFLVFSFLQPLGVIHWVLLVILFEL